MKHWLMINLYLAVAVFFYMRTSVRMTEAFDKKEFLSGSFIGPHVRALYEFLALVLALGWFITIPVLVAYRLADENR